MDDKKNIYEEDEQLVRELFDSFTPSEPSKEFTKNTMNMVLQEWSSHPEGVKTGVSLQYKVLMGVAAALIVFLVYIFDVKQVANSADLASLFNFDSSSINQSIGSIAGAFKQIPSLVYIVSFGVGALLFADKLIHRLVNG
ncbi:hypothetical protein [Labilibacter marinus]|uniref:hypothetical protein n=1 Tax=Labilibacter marinus TaxID=1477105 RepID=UPI00095027BE|nr:hypothetical protein [Labilibacter marinus]